MFCNQINYTVISFALDKCRDGFDVSSSNANLIESKKVFYRSFETRNGQNRLRPILDHAENQFSGHFYMTNI